MKTTDEYVYYRTMTLISDDDIRRMFVVFYQHYRLGPIEIYIEFGRSDDEVIVMKSPP